MVRLASVAFLILALARPQIGRGTIPEFRRGIAVMIVLDRSGSMAEPIRGRDGPLPRWEAAKEAARLFVTSTESLKDSGDLLGLVAFARHAETVCPLTWNHDLLDTFLEELRVEEDPRADGTALGDAVALAVARLAQAESVLKEKGAMPKPSSQTAFTHKATHVSSAKASPFSIAAKVIIVLTDGRNNAGHLHPEEAAQLAAHFGVRIHSVGIADEEEYLNVPTLVGTLKTTAPPGIDESTLQSLAQDTGGSYHRVRSAEDLRKILAHLKEMERTSMPTDRVVLYVEAYTWFVVAGLLGLVAEAVLRSSVLQSLP